MDGLIAVDGQVFSPEKAVISAQDRGFLLGDAIFETLVAFDGKVLDAGRHLTRLRASAETLSMPVPWSDAELEFELTSLAEQVRHAKKSLRLVVTRGKGSGIRIPKDAHPTRVTYCFKAPEEPAGTYRDGLALKRMLRPGAVRGPAPKTPNYLASLLAMQHAEQEACHDILWTNGDGEVTESSTANIFFMARDGDNVTLVTPPAQSGILLGITRETLIMLLRKATIPVREQIVHIDELPRFDEAFLCSTVRGLVPVSRIDKHKLFSARPTAVYRHVERLFHTWVATELGFRVDWPTGRPI